MVLVTIMVVGDVLVSELSVVVVMGFFWRKGFMGIVVVVDVGDILG